MFRTGLLLLAVFAPQQRIPKAEIPPFAIFGDSADRPIRSRCFDSQKERAASVRSTRGANVFVEGVKAVSLGKSLMLLGYPTIILGEAHGSRAPSNETVYLGVRLIDGAVGEPIPLPERTGAYRVLRVAYTPAGTVDVLWRSDGPGNSLLSRDSLRSASWNGTSWSSLRVVTGFGPASSWSPLRVSTPVRGADGPWLRAADRIVRWTTSGWQASGVADRAELYFDGLSLTRGVDLMTYIANASPGGNSVFLTRSTDSGKTWSAGQRVGPAVPVPAYEPHLLALGPRRIALVWIEGSEALIGRTLRIALSRDAGRTWHEQAPYRLPHPARTLSAAVDPLGTIHVVTQLASDTASSYSIPYHAMWRGTWSGRWLAPKSATAFGIATVDVFGPHSVVMTWSELEGLTQASMPVTKLVVTDAACFVRAGRTP